MGELYHEPVDISAPRWDRPYPPVPEGWRLGPPDFVGIGAQKAGTSWWYRLLRLHPDVADNELKETHHLVTLGWRPMTRRDVLSYHRYFPRPAGAIAGEWTPRYLPSPGVVETLRACAPDARILVLVRDPVARYRSGLAEWMRGKQHRGRRQRLALGREDAFTRSFYGFPLRRYVEAFGADRVLIQQLERCRLEPVTEYARLLRFLGLRDWTPPAGEIETPVNVTERPAGAVTPEAPADLARRFDDDIRLLRDLMPDLDLTLWPDHRHLA